MVDLRKVEALIQNLQDRIEKYPNDSEYSTGYKDALNDCLYDIQQAFDTDIEREILECMPPEEIMELFYDQFITSI